MLIRPATHSGSWYLDDRTTLEQQLRRFFAKAPTQKHGARVLVGPHAGYAYCGQRLAETYKAWDCKSALRVFLLGPSHHAYFKGSVLLSPYSAYATPLGTVDVDVDTCEALVAGSGGIRYMSQDVDENEHLFEMHLPFLVQRCVDEGVPVPPIVPVMVSGLSVRAREAVVAALLPYFQDSTSTFVVLSDFCHWGRRFGYTGYVPEMQLLLLTTYQDARIRHTPIYKSIEYLDRAAMLVASAGSAAKWDAYIETTGNTICGQKPIAIVLLLLEAYLAAGGETRSDHAFQWLGYSQSSRAMSASDSSVSYASGYVLLK